MIKAGLWIRTDLMRIRIRHFFKLRICYSLQKKPSVLKREYPDPALQVQNIKILYFFLFLLVIFPPLDPQKNADPDAATQINADPDPQSWIKVERVFFVQTTRDETILAVDRPDYSKTSYSFDDWGKF